MKRCDERPLRRLAETRELNIAEDAVKCVEQSNHLTLFIARSQAYSEDPPEYNAKHPSFIRLCTGSADWHPKHLRMCQLVKKLNSWVLARLNHFVWDWHAVFIQGPGAGAKIIETVKQDHAFGSPPIVWTTS